MDFDWEDFDPDGTPIPDTGSHFGWGCPIDPVIANINTGESATWLGWINYFIPIAEFAGMLTLWLVAIGIYYVASIVLRWARAVS